MPEYPRWAPGTLPYMLDMIFFWTYRIAAVVFLFSVVGVAFIGRAPAGIWMTIISFLLWIGGWIARRLLHQYWQD